MFNKPLHNTKVVQHLNKCNEENNGAQNAGEEPALVDGLLIKEESCTDSGFPQEVGGEKSEPLEDAEASVGLEDEEGNRLLEKETNDDRLPANKSNSRSYIIPLSQGTYHGIRGLLWEVNQKKNWNTRRPRTEIARSP